jgi:hypothetical protein
MQSIAKLYESIIKDRLIKNITLHPAQAAFQKGKSTLHRIQSLNLFNETMKKTKQKCFYFFIDFKKAYDTIPPFLVLQQLRKNNLDEQPILIIEDLMKGNTTTFEWNDISTKQEVKLERGVRQGSVLSPILFNLAINELLIEISKICLILAYADDIVIACKERSLQNYQNP